MQHPPKKNAPAHFRDGYLASMPLMVGVAPFGVVFGALAISASMSPAQALGMSVFVIAGSSQFVGTTLLADQAPAGVIILTTFVINLRHLLYSASLSEIVRPLPLGWKLLMGYLMIDEVYAPAWQRYQAGDMSPQELAWYFVGGGVNLAGIWWLSTLAGTVIGNILADSTTEALGFTLPLIFTAIVANMLGSRSALWAALSASVAAVLLQPLPYNLGLLAAAGVGILAGVWTETPPPPRPIVQEDL
jgi:predicted branched-subunit amino acid permease